LEVRLFMPKYFLDVFENYRYNYQRIFSILYPSKNSTGFTERNLSVNFANAYEILLQLLGLNSSLEKITIYIMMQ